MSESMESKLTAEDVIHFGVKGMKWGVRRDRDLSTESDALREQSSANLRSYLVDSIKNDPTFGSSMTKEKYDSLSAKGETFAKNAVLRRVTMNKDAELKGNVYVSTLMKDSQFYKASLPALGVNSKNRGSGLKEYKQKHYELEMVATKKLSSPSEKERVDAFMELLEEPAVHVKGKDLPVTGRAYLEKLGYKIDFKEYDTAKLAFATWDNFTRMQGSQVNPLSKAYFDKIKSKGYNAIIDDYDRGRYTEKPLILLDPESTVQLRNVKPLTTDEINQAQRSLKKTE